MSKRIWTLGFATALTLVMCAWLAAPAQAGPPSTCGDGTQEGAELCDDGNTTAGDGCDENCNTEVCGNGVEQPALGETCDDGNTVSGDGCDATCILECGNGTQEGSEGCDDGNTVGGDGCSALCVPEVCGDGIVEPGTEECDDGNTVPDDTCDNDCNIVNQDPLTKDQQKCVNEANKGAANVLKAQSKDNTTCLKNAAAGKTDKLGAGGTFNDCLTNDVTGKVQKAKDKALAGRTKRCADPLPGFGFNADGAAVNQAAMDAAILLTEADVFGDPAAVADKKANKDGAACQGEMQKRIAKGLDTIWKEVNKAKKKSIKGSKTDPATTSSGELATDLATALTANQKVEKALDGVVSGTAKKCERVADVSGLFTGGCTNAQVAIVGACANRQIVCHACESLNAADGLGIDCDVLLQTILNDNTVTCL